MIIEPLTEGRKPCGYGREWTWGYGGQAGTFPRDDYEGNQFCRNLLAWSLAGDGGTNRHLVVVNLSGQPAQGRIPLNWPDLPGRSWRLTDLLRQAVFERDGGELASPGLYVALEPCQSHLLALR